LAAVSRRISIFLISCERLAALPHGRRVRRKFDRTNIMTNRIVTRRLPPAYCRARIPDWSVVLVPAVATASLLVATSAASAADLALKAKAPAARAFNWTGCYAGVNAGGGASGSNFTTTVDSGTHLTDPGDLAAVSASGSNSINDSSFMGGGQLGCSLQTGSLVFGIEGDADYFRTSPNVTTTGTLSTGETYAVTNTVTTNGFATLRPRFGIASDRTFVFLTGGAAFTRATFTQGYTDTSGGAGSSSMSTSLVGWTAGAGVEYAWTDHWSLKGEYLFASFPTKSFVTGIADAAGGTNLLHGAADLTIQSARLGVNYKF
jgi:outer membrane immunogenic protein